MSYWTRERLDGLGAEGITSCVRPEGDGWVEVADTHPLRQARGDTVRVADGKLVVDDARAGAAAALRAARTKAADDAASAELEAAIAAEPDPAVKAELERRRAQ